VEKLKSTQTEVLVELKIKALLTPSARMSRYSAIAHTTLKTDVEIFCHALKPNLPCQTAYFGCNFFNFESRPVKITRSHLYFAKHYGPFFSDLISGT